MSGVVLDETGRALVFDRVTGEVSRHTVPTAVENVALGAGRYVHGSSGPALVAPEEPAAPVAEEPVIALTEPDVLPLPPAEEEQPAKDPFDRDGDGKPGGSLPGPRPRGRPRAKK